MSMMEMLEYSDDQARDDHGMWTSGGTMHSSMFNGPHGQRFSVPGTSGRNRTVYTHGGTGEKVSIQHNLDTGIVDMTSEKPGAHGSKFQSRQYVDHRSANLRKDLKAKGLGFHKF